MELDDIFNWIDRFLNKRLGNISARLYKNFYEENIRTLVNKSVFILIFLLNLFYLKLSVWIVPLTSVLSLLLTHQFKIRLYEYIGWRMFRLKRIDNYELLQHYDSSPDKSMSTSEFKFFQSCETYKITSVWSPSLA